MRKTHRRSGQLDRCHKRIYFCVTYKDHAINKRLHAHAERALHSPRHTEAHTLHSVRKRTPNPFPRVRQQRRALGLPLPAEGAEECVPRRTGWRRRRRAVDALRVEEEYIVQR